MINLDVPDSTDFPPSHLRQLDSSLRCTICSEFFDAPVTLVCGHCFCSACLREALAIKQECPSCRKAAKEQTLRPNPALEEIISHWKACRSEVLAMVNRERSDAKDSKKRKAEDSDDEIECIAGPSRSAAITGASSAEISSKPKSSKKLKRLDTEPIEEEVNAVDCPVCQKKVSHEKINQHLDNNCSIPIAKSKADSGSERKDAYSMLMSPKGKGKEKAEIPEDDPIPKVSYDTLKEKQIKDLLQEHGLSLAGDRHIMATRHQKWRILFNANLDKRKRVSRAQLKKDLYAWEDQMKRKKDYTVEDTKAYAREHQEDFKTLVEAARPNKAPLEKTTSTSLIAL
ncbi:hypothetical protein C8J56DRAFT_266020 [Mycena floridula]|nr:hypothetical protein C8J56DRAFT_266020 [Mycena floridula]